MARNLAQETKEEQKPEEKKETKDNKEIVLITFEQAVLNNLSEIYTKMIEGFKQVGVKFEDTK